MDDRDFYAYHVSYHVFRRKAREAEQWHEAAYPNAEFKVFRRNGGMRWELRSSIPISR